MVNVLWTYLVSSFHIISIHKYKIGEEGNKIWIR